MEHTETDILFVEDNSSDAELTIRALRKVNLADKLIHVEDGKEALDFLFAEGIYAGRADMRMPKVILLDIKMPRVDGIEVLRRIKADDRTKKIPVVIMTSSNEDKDILASYGLGVNSYIVKPVEFASFANAVSDLGLYWLLVNRTPDDV